MDDPNLPDEQPSLHSIDPNAGHVPIPMSALNSDIISLILQMQAQQTLEKSQEVITRGSWSQQEDDLLTNAVQQLGPKKWTDIAKFVPSRTSKQCRERWFNRLSPDLKHDPFEQWEDNIIIQKQRDIGNRWALIAKELPGRSTNSIKNRWYSCLKSQHETMAQYTLNPLSTMNVLGSNSNDFSNLQQHITADMIMQQASGLPADLLMTNTAADLSLHVSEQDHENPNSTDL